MSRVTDEMVMAALDAFSDRISMRDALEAAAAVRPDEHAALREKAEKAEESAAYSWKLWYFERDDNEKYKVQVSDLTRERDEALARCERAVEVLNRVQWSATYYDEQGCPICSGSSGSHSSCCELAAVLADTPVPDRLAAEPSREDLTIVARSIGRTMKWENHQERAKDVFRSLRERDDAKPADKMPPVPDRLAAEATDPFAKDIDTIEALQAADVEHKPFAQFRAEVEAKLGTRLERLAAEREAGRRAGLENLRKLSEAATPGPWKWWTSNSWLRLGTDARGNDRFGVPYGQDGYVACPYVSRGDGHPDLCIRNEADRELIVAAVNFLRRALRDTPAEGGEIDG